MSEIMKIVAEWSPTLHEGIWCDECNVSPISGNRYWKQLQNDTYDLCESCYENLDDDKKGELALKQPQSGQEDLVAKEEPVQEPVEEPVQEPVEEPVEERSAEEAVFDTTDLTASCMADIEETFKQLSEQDYQEAEAEAARLIAQAEAKAAEEAAAAKAAEEAAAAKAAEEAAAVKAAEEAAAVKAAEEAAAEEQAAIPLEWQGVVTALVNMGF